MTIPPMRTPDQIEGLIELGKWANEQDAYALAVEIGAFAGEGSVVLARYFEFLLCVDPWINGYDETDVASQQWPMSEVFQAFRERIKNAPNVRYRMATSLDIAGTIKNNTVDLVYIDGNHQKDAVLGDLVAWSHKLKPKGIIAGHDWSMESVQRAYQLLFDDPPTLFLGDSWARQIGMITRPDLSIITGCHIHETAKVMPFVNLYDSDIAEDAFIGPFVELGGCVIGARSVISSHSYVCPGVTIGNDVFVAHNVSFTNDLFTDVPRFKSLTELRTKFSPKLTRVGNRVRIGSGAVILPVKIGDDVIIGAGTVVTRDVPDGTTVWGTPSRPDPRGTLRG